MMKLLMPAYSEKGITLIEILASIVLLSIIILSLLSFFLQSSQSNRFSENIIEATYVAESNMEEMNNVISSNTITNLIYLTVPSDFKRECPDGSCYSRIVNTNRHYVFVKLELKGNLVKVKVEVKNMNQTKLEAQMEKLVSWKY